MFAAIVKDIVQTIVSTLKKSFSFKGRATRKEFWLFWLFTFIVYLLLGVVALLLAGSVLGTIWGILSLIVCIALLIPYISVAVRRFHDLGLSGFWFWYLNPVGLPVIFVVYLLGLDKVADRIVEKIQNVGSPWLGWILTWLFWPCGATAALLLLFLYAGKKEDNEFGPNPYIA